MGIIAKIGEAFKSKTANVIALNAGILASGIVASLGISMQQNHQLDTFNLSSFFNNPIKQNVQPVNSNDSTTIAQTTSKNSTIQSDTTTPKPVKIATKAADNLAFTAPEKRPLPIDVRSTPVDGMAVFGTTTMIPFSSSLKSLDKIIDNIKQSEGTITNHQLSKYFADKKDYFLATAIETESFHSRMKNDPFNMPTFIDAGGGVDLGFGYNISIRSKFKIKGFENYRNVLGQTKAQEIVYTHLTQIGIPTEVAEKVVKVAAKPSTPENQRVLMKLMPKISLAQGIELLDLARHEYSNDAKNFVGIKTWEKLKPNEQDALAYAAYNCGMGAKQSDLYQMRPHIRKMADAREKIEELQQKGLKDSKEFKRTMIEFQTHYAKTLDGLKISQRAGNKSDPDHREFHDRPSIYVLSTFANQMQNYTGDNKGQQRVEGAFGATEAHHSQYAGQIAMKLKKDLKEQFPEAFTSKPSQQLQKATQEKIKALQTLNNQPNTKNSNPNKETKKLKTSNLVPEKPQTTESLATLQIHPLLEKLLIRAQALNALTPTQTADSLIAKNQSNDTSKTLDSLNKTQQIATILRQKQHTEIAAAPSTEHTKKIKL